MAELYDKCIKNGLRMTLPRKVILEVIEDSEDHPDVDELYRRAVSKDRSIFSINTESLVNTTKKQMKAQMLGTIYAEVIKNLELSKTFFSM